MAYKKYLTDRNIFIFLFVFALILRIMFANDGIPHFDSIADANKAPLTIETGKFQYSYGYGAPGIIVLLTTVYAVDHWITGATNAEFAYFFITFITAALSISMLYLVVRKITKDKLIGFFAAVFFCVTPIYLSVTTYPKTHGPGVFFVLLAGYYLLKSADGGEKELRHIIYSGFLFGFATVTRILSFVYFIPFAILCLKIKISKKGVSFNKNILSIKNFAGFVISFLIPFLLFIPRILHKGMWGFVKFTFIEGKAVAWQESLFNMVSFAFGELHKSITWLGWIVVLLGIFYLYKKNRVALSAFSVWFVLFLYLGTRGGSEARFFIPVLVVLMIFMACGTKVVYINNKIAGAIVALVLVVWMFAVIYPVISYRHDYSGQKEFALWVASVTEEDSILVTTDEGFFYTFYTGRVSLTSDEALLCDKPGWTGHYQAGSNQDIMNFLNLLNNCLQKGHPVYIAQSGIGYDPGGRLAGALQENFNVYLVGSKKNEAYSQNTLQFQFYDEKLFKIEGKGGDGEP